MSAGMDDSAEETASLAAPLPAPQAAFAALLQRLGAEGPPPAVMYEQLRRRLIVYFRLQLPAEAEALADETLDRVARKLEQGTGVQQLQRYVYGVARLVCLEARAREQKMHQAVLDPTLALHSGLGAADEAADEAALLAALNTCLGQLGVRSSELILRYYAGQGAAGQRARQGLAQEWNISINALRNKALRIRQALEQCVRRRLQGLGDA